jgi:signal transduction histidine kinase
VAEDIIRALNETRRQLAAMRDVASTMGTQLELAALLPAVIKTVCEAVSCERASLFLVDDTSGEVWSRVQIGHDEVIRLPRGAGVAGAVVSARCPIRLDDAWADARFHRGVDEATGYRTRTLLAVPVVDKDGGVRGVVEALNKRVPERAGAEGDATFSDDDERLLMALGAEIAVALERARLFEEVAAQRKALDRRVSELNLLVDVFIGADGVEELLHIVVARAKDLVAAAAASVALIDPRTSALVFRAAAGVGQQAIHQRAIPSDTGFAGVALASRTTVRVDDAAADPRHPRTLSQQTTLLPGPLMAVPLLGDGDDAPPLGVLTLLRPRGEAGFTDDDERIMGLVGARIAQVLIDEERKEKARTQAQLQTIGHMLAGIVHDFKTPMTVISGYTQMMAADDDAASRGESAQLILKSCDQMTTMIKELLNFAKGDSTVLLRKDWPETFVADLEPMLRRLVDQTPIALSVRCATNAAVRLDDLKMKRAIVNLVKNAKEALLVAGTAAPAIAFDVRADGDGIVFVVADNGPGLAPAIEARLFESFATYGKADGTGLGLALVKRIAEEHHGNVVVDSVAGRGCTFTVRVPRA